MRVNCTAAECAVIAIIDKRLMETGAKRVSGWDELEALSEGETEADLEHEVASEGRPKNNEPNSINEHVTYTRFGRVIRKL
ncbi:hypothetical protein B0J17DRAFT_671126 [Rhizoctonia solani]|nr:hypothetical protein B0J17DRAFT_671126 [Rhizoctonia solani]